jgi:hypothetical protein
MKMMRVPISPKSGTSYFLSCSWTRGSSAARSSLNGLDMKSSGLSACTNPSFVSTSFGRGTRSMCQGYYARKQQRLEQEVGEAAKEESGKGGDQESYRLDGNVKLVFEESS